MELSNSGITLSLVEPGPILSNFRKNAFMLAIKGAQETIFTMTIKKHFEAQIRPFSEKYNVYPRP